MGALEDKYLKIRPYEPREKCEIYEKLTIQKGRYLQRFQKNCFKK